MTTQQRRAILLARLSDNREDLDLTDEGIPKSLDDQVKRMENKAAELRWQPWKVIQNPKLSAYKRRKVVLPTGQVDFRVWRPDLREALDDLWSGRANALIALDLDRAFRDPKDLQDLIDVVENAPHDIQVESVTGSLRLAKGRDPFDAEIRVLVANKASRDTARRVAMARERRAREGKFGGGKRPFGFEDDGVTIRDCEALEIKKASLAILAGVSLRAVTQDLRAREVPTVKGGIWNAEAVKDILSRPRNAGLLVYKGEVLDGKLAPWEPIVPVEQWKAVKDKLQVRKAPPGRAARWLGSNIYVCICGSPLQAHSQRTRPARYRCRMTNRMANGHVSRECLPMDAFIGALVVEWSSQPEAMSILIPENIEEIDFDALRAEAAAKKEELDQIAHLKARGKLTLGQVVIMTEEIQKRLDEIDDQLSRALPVSPINSLVQSGLLINDETERRAKVRAEWDGYSLGHKRAIIRKLMTVHVLEAPRGPGFDPNFIKVTWNYEGGPR